MRKPTTVPVILIGTAIALLIFGLGSVAWSTSSNRKDASEMIASRARVAEFVTRFGEPTYEYEEAESLPEYLRRDVPSSILDDGTFYYFAMEGLPSYWSFLVVMPPNSDRISWGMVRSKP